MLLSYARNSMVVVVERTPDGAYARLLRQALDSKPPTRDRPFRLALYADEVTPGNVVSPDNQRKAWCAYWALLDLCPQSLHDEDAWFVLAIKRSSEVGKIDGKFSAVRGAGARAEVPEAQRPAGSER